MPVYDKHVSYVKSKRAFGKLTEFFIVLTVIGMIVAILANLILKPTVISLQHVLTLF